MKFSDIQKLHEADLITANQRDKIIAHFGLKEEGTKFLVIISFIGAVMVAAGIILLISAHWDEIPRGVKIAAGLALMLGAHGSGWWLREISGTGFQPVSLLPNVQVAQFETHGLEARPLPRNTAKPARRCNFSAPRCSSPTSHSSARFITSSAARPTPSCSGCSASPHCRGCCGPRHNSFCCSPLFPSGSAAKSTSATA